ncbi:MAG: N-acetylmuramoyl-L-alanine amidase [Firmicutes bacterium]|nr:N-acetylmuramoyl-L-alanine amidase [Bacillota bacterium]
MNWFFPRPMGLKFFLAFILFLLVQLFWPMLVFAPTHTPQFSSKVVVIDAGHGGEDPGTIHGSIYEKDINLAVALRLEKILLAQDVQVVMTRRTDIDYIVHRRLRGEKTRKQSDLDRRLEIANEHGADLLISLHVNCWRKYQAGAEVFYNPQSDRSALLAQWIQQELRQIPGMTKRIAKAGDYYLIIQADMPAVIVEMGYLSSPKERQLLLTPTYQEQLAQAIAAGIVRYLREGETQFPNPDV